MLMPSIFGDNLFDDFMNDFPFFDDRDMKKMEKKLYGRHGKNLMKTDIRETEDSYELEMDLPGFSKDEVKVSLENGCLTISAAKGVRGRGDPACEADGCVACEKRKALHGTVFGSKQRF